MSVLHLPGLEQAHEYFVGLAARWHAMACWNQSQMQCALEGPGIGRCGRAGADVAKPVCSSRSHTQIYLGIWAPSHLGRYLGTEYLAVNYPLASHPETPKSCLGKPCWITVGGVLSPPAPCF